MVRLGERTKGGRKGLGGMIEVTEIRAGYGDGADILNGISMTANQRELVTILGSNGCGKSTLLKTIAGFLKPRSGNVYMHGQDVSAVAIHDKVRNYRVGYVPQSDNVFGNLTVAENVMLGARFLDRATAATRFDSMMEGYPARASKTKRKASALSGGERQLLSLARALVSGPEILLLDEPSAGLSPLMLHDVFDAIVRIRDDQNMCIVMVEQTPTSHCALPTVPTFCRWEAWPSKQKPETFSTIRRCAPYIWVDTLTDCCEAWLTSARGAPGVLAAGSIPATILEQIATGICRPPTHSSSRRAREP